MITFFIWIVFQQLNNNVSRPQGLAVFHSFQCFFNFLKQATTINSYFFQLYDHNFFDIFYLSFTLRFFVCYKIYIIVSLLSFVIFFMVFHACNTFAPPKNFSIFSKLLFQAVFRFSTTTLLLLYFLYMFFYPLGLLLLLLSNF